MGRERNEQGEMAGQRRPRSPKTVQSAEGGEGKDKRERMIVVVRSPCQENDPADAHPSAHKSVWESANPAWTRSVHLDAPGQRHGQQPIFGTADPGVVKQDKSSRSSVDTTKTCSGPQRVRMSSGERPIGAAKGAMIPRPCANPPPPPSVPGPEQPWERPVSIFAQAAGCLTPLSPGRPTEAQPKSPRPWSTCYTSA